MANYGYCRVSAADQNEDRPLIAMGEKNILLEMIFTNKLSVKDFNRPADTSSDVYCQVFE